MIVYCIENTINQKKYVGITTKSIEKRLKNHIQSSKRSNSQTLHKAIQKYGIENFKISEIDTAESIEELYEKEKEWIQKLDTKNSGYNETDGGEGSHGRILSEQTKDKIRQKQIKRFKNPREKKKTSEATKRGMKKWWDSLTDEEKNTWIENCKKRPEGWVQPTGWTYSHTEKAKKKIGNAHKGKILSEETKRKVSESRKGKGTGSKNAMSNPEHRSKQKLGCQNRKRVYREDGSWYWGKKN